MTMVVAEPQAILLALHRREESGNQTPTLPARLRRLFELRPPRPTEARYIVGRPTAATRRELGGLLARHMDAHEPGTRWRPVDRPNDRRLLEAPPRQLARPVASREDRELVVSRSRAV